MRVPVNIKAKRATATHRGVNAEIETGKEIVAVQRYIIKAVRAWEFPERIMRW
jgi:hypothetical protein